MIDEDVYCVDVMNQIAAVQSALSAVSKELLGRHLDTCVRSAMESGRRVDRERAVVIKAFTRADYNTANDGAA
jgi:DNA-binding FrmR family transcriptional regulator